MKIIGLTGGIGSGKSTVAMIFNVLGVPVYNSDQRAKELYFEPKVRSEVEALIGKNAYLGVQELDKDYIRKKIFDNTELLKKLNDIIHPAVGEDFELFKKKHKDAPLIMKETALLFEAGIEKSVDKIVVVVTSPELRNKRVALRDKLSNDQVDKIVSQQMPEKEKAAKADWVIENNEENLLVPQVLKIFKSF